MVTVDGRGFWRDSWYFTVPFDMDYGTAYMLEIGYE